MSYKLQVYSAQSKVGELIVANGEKDLVFQYSPEWLINKNNFPLSLSLPFTPTPYQGKKITTYFQNLALPRDERSSTSETLLQQLSQECPGALRFRQRNEIEGANRGKYSLLNEAFFKRLVETQQGEGQPVYVNQFGQRTLPIISLGENLYIAREGSPSMYLLKAASQALSGLLENEYICMTLARDLGLRVGRVKLQKHNRAKYILIERSDRVFSKEGLTLLHQETVAQSLGVTNVTEKRLCTYKNYFKLIENYSSYPARDKTQLLKLIVFNLFIGNTIIDGHRISLNISREGVNLTVFSGLFSTTIYGAAYQKFKTPLHRVTSLNQITQEVLKEFSQDIHMPYKLVKKEIERQSQEIIPALNQLLKKIHMDPLLDFQTIDKIKNTIENNTQFMKTLCAS